VKIPVYYVIEGEMSVISLVEHPAIETDFQVFDEQKTLQFSYDEEKHIAFGPAMIADQLIYRIDPKSNTPYYLVFTADVIESLVTKAVESGKLDFNLQHSGKSIEGVYLLESFIKRPGLQPLGFEQVSDGSWFVSLKVENKEIWNQIKQGAYKGFSIEALLDIEPKEESLDDLINNILD
jgi:hypothetical protein